MSQIRFVWKRRMAGEACTSGQKKRYKVSRQESNRSAKDSEIEIDRSEACNSHTTRGGIRVYKIVVLGDGGVGKSGTYIASCVSN